MYFTVGSAKGPGLKDKNKTLADYLSDANPQDITLCFKDLGPQIAWKTVFLVEYAGPLLITLALVFLRRQIYRSDAPMTFNQKLGAALVVLHYVKRELETLFVHRFGTDTMPWTNILKNSLHYWVIFGVCCMYFFLKPGYQTPAWQTKSISGLLAALFLVFEALNLKTHLILRDLRTPGTSERNIPHGYGFGLVSCANYLWETLAWTSFAVLASTCGSYFFLAVAFAQMLIWAREKHARYRREFPEYPKNRKAMVPFII